MRPGPEELFGPAGTPRVVVVGAGFGGIAAGVKMKRAGIHTFTIYESSLGVGGTWWDNTYPGAEVDVGSHLYSYSFKTHNWTRTHAQQAELQKYLEETVDEYGLRPHLRLGVAVDSAAWDDDRHVWTVHLDDGTTDECHVLISGVGFLNVPRYPDWPGLDDFEGPSSTRHVGSTTTTSLTRSSPSWARARRRRRSSRPSSPSCDTCTCSSASRVGSCPRVSATSPTRSARRSRTRGRGKRERLRQLWVMERNIWGGNLFRVGAKANVERRQMCLDYIDRTFADRPDLREAVTPTYPYPGKRPIFATGFYPALMEPNVELVPKAVASLTRTGIVDADGVEREIDVLVMATGFQPADYLARLQVVGRTGKTLQEYWAGEPNAFLGITVPEFPNFFMLYGPGTNGGDIVTMLEGQAEYAVRALRRMRRERVTAVEVRPSFAARWNRWLQSQMKGMSWTVSNNYFKAPSGKIVTQWPLSCSVYRVLLKLFGRVSETTRRRMV